ncbi:MAG: glucuronyl hydrolase [Pirellulaceae bacterium]|nr:MAG: glucuronyl hydrolase [Pirellulaceae bacterium]
MSDVFFSALEFAQQQVRRLIEKYPDYFPIYTKQGKWYHDGELWTDWTGGFLAGMMWRFYQLTRDRWWWDRAVHYSQLLEHRQHDRNVHDLGFIFLNTYLPWYRWTGDERLNQVLIQAGRTLALRYQPRGKYLCSFIGPQSLFIDIMMNVPLVFYAARQTNDEQLYRIAEQHCRTTRDRLVRADGSTAHEGLFNPDTGEFLGQSTHQGLAAGSVWARGLAWSLYGFSQVYELTGNEEFLEVARRNADYWIRHLPEDGVPYWDFCADLSQPPPWGAQKESSAGAIAAAGLLHLAGQDADAERCRRYRQTALHTLRTLCTPEYLANHTPDWEGILKHGVYHTAKNLGVDESVMWGEYFFVEALTRVVTEGEQNE